MGPGPSGPVGPSAPRRVAEELKLVNDPVPILHQRATGRVAWEQWRRLGRALRTHAQNVSFCEK